MNEQPSKVSAPYGKLYFQKFEKTLLGLACTLPPPSTPTPPRLHVRSSPAVNLTTRVA